MDRASDFVSVPMSFRFTVSTADSMDDVYYEWVDVSPYLGNRKPRKFYAPRKNYHVSLIARDDPLSDGSSNNKSIIATAGPSIARPLSFRGPMVAIREVDYDTYCDISLADFRCLSEYLRCYGVPASAMPTISRGTSIHTARANRGVKIRRQRWSFQPGCPFAFAGDRPYSSPFWTPPSLLGCWHRRCFGCA